MKIFEFDSARVYLNAVYLEKRERNPRFSLRAWAKQMGDLNATTLSRALSGTRPISASLMKTLSENLKLSNDECKYFELLIQLQESRTEEERKLFENLLNEIRQANASNFQIPLSVFALIADWYHTAIREMTYLKDFRFNPQWIRKRLRFQIDERQIRESVEKGIESGLLKKIEAGNESPRLEKSNDDSIFVDHQIPSRAVRMVHEQFISLAKRSVVEQSPDERLLAASTIAIRKEDYPKIKEMIEKTHRQILQFAAKDEADDVYQICSQVFKLTQVSDSAARPMPD